MTNQEGNDIDVPDAPLSYLVMQWRRKMHVGWFEAMRMPLSVIIADIEMMSIEAEVQQKYIARQKTKDMA